MSDTNDAQFFREGSHSTAELHLSGLIGKASQPVLQKIRIIGFFFENRLHWQFKFGYVPASKPF